MRLSETHVALMKALADNPIDVELRSVYADYLQENNMGRAAARQREYIKIIKRAGWFVKPYGHACGAIVTQTKSRYNEPYFVMQSFKRDGNLGPISRWRGETWKRWWAPLLVNLSGVGGSADK